MKLLTKLAVFLGTWVCLFLVGEGIIRLVSSRKLIYTLEMVKYANRLKMGDPKGQMSHIHRPNASAKLMGVDISLNSLGNRGPEPNWNTLEENHRILVMGSSITMGWGVPYENTFSHLLEKGLNEQRQKSTVVFNASIGNYNASYQHILLGRQLPTLEPNLVLVQYFINDAEPNPRLNSQINKYSYLSAFLTTKLAKISFSQTSSLIDYYQELYSSGGTQWKKTLQTLKSMKTMANKTGAEFSVMIVADIHNLSQDSPYENIYQFVETQLRDSQINTINTFPAFQERFGTNEKELWIQPDDPHPNEKGHRLMADIALQSVGQPKLLFSKRSL